MDEDDLYAALDWLLSRQEAIEQALARRHLQAGQLVLFDVTSTYFEGRHLPLAKLRRSRDGKRDKLQIVFRVLTNGDSCPVAVEVFNGDTRGSEDGHGGPDEGAAALRLGAADSGRGPGDADGGAHSRRAGRGRGARVDHGAPRAGDSGAGAQWRPPAVLV